MTRVGIGQQHGVRQVLAQHVGVSDWNHIVEDPIHDEAWLTYFGELDKALPAEMFPGPKSFQRFSAAEGAGAHCESGARAQFNQRIFDWLDDVLAARVAASPRAA